MINFVNRFGNTLVKLRNTTHLLRYSSIGTPKIVNIINQGPKLNVARNTSSHYKEPSPPACPPPPPPSSNNNGLKYGILGAGLLGAGALIYVLLNQDDNNGGAGGPPPTDGQTASKAVPASSADIPKEVPYLLIGGGTASFSAFRAIKSHDPKAKVMVITNEYEIPYMRPPLSKELWFYGGSRDENKKENLLKFKQWNGAERSLYYETEDFYVDPKKLLDNPNGGVTVVRGYTVKEIDVCNQIATLEDGTKIKYGECLIATGSTPRNIDILDKAPEHIKNKVSVFKTVDDYDALRKILKTIKSIAVIGGGFLGSELSCALAKYKESDVSVHQVFYEGGNMGKILPEYLSHWTTERVKEEGVNVLANSQIKSVSSAGDQVKLELVDGRYVLVDHVVVAVGAQPNTNLAGPSKLEVDDKHGGYVVNAELEARRHVYVAGDAACFYDPQLGRRRVEHHDHAVVSGRLAGENMVGLKKPYLHQSMFWSDLGPLIGYEAIGLIDSSLPTVGVFAKRADKDIPASSQVDNLSGADRKGSTSSQNSVSKPAETKPTTDAVSETKCPVTPEEDFGKGIIFYLRDDKVVGVLLWNVFNRINIARKVIAENKKFDDLNEVAKLFDIHEQKA